MVDGLPDVPVLFCKQREADQYTIRNSLLISAKE